MSIVITCSIRSWLNLTDLSAAITPGAYSQRWSIPSRWSKFVLLKWCFLTAILPFNNYNNYYNNDDDTSCQYCTLFSIVISAFICFSILCIPCIFSSHLNARALANKDSAKHSLFAREGWLSDWPLAVAILNYCLVFTTQGGGADEAAMSSTHMLKIPHGSFNLLTSFSSS